MNGKEITILYNGIIYTVDNDEWDKKPVDSLAYDENGIIVAVGKEDVDKYAKNCFKKIDLKGNVVLPGFIDSHVHAPGTAFMDLFEIDLNGTHNKKDALSTIKMFIDEHPEMDAYFAGGFDMSIIDENGESPCAAWLDEICSDKPVTIKSSDMHSRWLNTKSMALSGIGEDSEVNFGHIHRYNDGSLKGVFTDCKELPILEPVYDVNQQLEAIQKFIKTMNAWGYTSIMSIAPIMIFDVERYLNLEHAKELTLRVNCAQMILPNKVDVCIDNLLQLKSKFRESSIKISTGKFLVDGVLEGQTACLKKPYDLNAGLGPDYCGQLNWDYDQLREATKALISSGFQAHYHCIGDAAATAALDAIEYGQTDTGITNLRHVLTHLQVVDRDDFKRFRELGVIAAIQPFWHFKEPGWFENVDAKVLGKERAEMEYPAKSLADYGAMLTSSGDYPVSQSNNPFHGIQAGVTRNIYNEDYGITISDIDEQQYLLNSNERLSIKQMVESYTINGAYELYREKEIGSIACGKCADLIVIDRDILNINILDIHNTEILATIFNGNLVYGQL